MCRRSHVCAAKWKVRKVACTCRLRLYRLQALARTAIHDAWCRTECVRSVKYVRVCMYAKGCPFPRFLTPHTLNTVQHAPPQPLSLTLFFAKDCIVGPCRVGGQQPGTVERFCWTCDRVHYQKTMKGPKYASVNGTVVPVTTPANVEVAEPAGVNGTADAREPALAFSTIQKTED